MFAGLDEREFKPWPRGLALGVGVLDAAWSTEAFIEEERLSLSRLASLAEGGRVDVDARVEVVKFIRARVTRRDGRGVTFRRLWRTEPLASGNQAVPAHRVALVNLMVAMGRGS